MAKAKAKEKDLSILLDHIRDMESYRDVLLEYNQLVHQIEDLEDELPDEIRDAM